MERMTMWRDRRHVLIIFQHKKTKKKFKIIFCSSFLQNVPLWVAKMKNAEITLKKTDFNHINYITGRSVRPLQPMILKAITKNS